MAEPIVRSFVIDTTQAEQNLKSLDAATTATNAALDTLYTQLIALDEQLNKLEPNTDAFNVVNTQIKALEDTITGIETGKIEAIGTAIEGIDVGNAVSEINAVGEALDTINPDTATAAIDEVESAINSIDTTEATQKIGEIDTALESIDTASVVTDIDNINTALSTIDASAAVGQVESVNTALDAVDTSNVTAQIQNINSELASVDVSTAINEIAQINEEFNQIDTTNLISEITGIGDSVNEIDTSNVVSEISNINTELNAIDATNVTADINEISTAIGGIDASSAVGEISSIDNALTGIDTGEVVGQINNIGEAVSDINTNNITSVGDAVEGVVAPVNNLATATDKLNTELKETKVDTSSIDAAKQDFQELVVQEEAVTNSSKSLKAQLRELQAQLAATDPDSAKYRELSQAAGELKDKIQDAAQAVGTQAGGAFERVGGSLGLVTSRIANLDFEGAAEGAKLLAQNITQIKPGDIAKGIQGIGSAFASIGKALLTNPIFLIGAAIAAAIVYAEELLSLIDGVTDAEQKALKVQEDRAKLAKEQVDAIGAQEESLKRQGLTEKQITDLKLKALDTAILEQQVVVETARTQLKAQVDAATRNAEYLRGFLDFVTLPQRKLAEFFQNFVNGAITVLNKLGLDVEKIDITSVFDDVNNFIVKKVFDPEQVKKDGEATLKESEKTLTGLVNQRDGILNAQDAKEVANAKKTADEKLKIEQDLNKQILDSRNKTAAESAKITEQIRKDAAKPIESAKTEVTDFDAQLKAQRDAQAFSISLMEEGVDKEIAAADLKYSILRDAAKGNAEQLKAIAAQNAADVDAIQQRAAQKELADAQAVQDAKLALASQSLGAIANLATAFGKGDEERAKKAFKIQKAASIAQATVDTYKGAQGIFANAAINPATILFPAQPYIQAALAVAAGLVNVKNIASQQFQSNTPPSSPPPSGGGGVGGGGGGSQPAQFNPLASSFLQERPEQLTPRAYVLAGDVASQQEVRIKVEDLARIG